MLILQQRENVMPPKYCQFHSMSRTSGNRHQRTAPQVKNSSAKIYPKLAANLHS